MSPVRASDAVVLAHGMSGGRTVPVPFHFAVVAAGVAVLLSFLIAVTLRKESVLRGDSSGRALPAGTEAVLDSRLMRAALRSLGLAGAVFFVVAAAYGPADSLVNPAAGIVYIFFWFGLIPLSLVFGPVWKLLNPLRTLHALIAALGGVPGRRGPLALPNRVGYWPAAAGLAAFTWLELVAPAGDHPRVLFAFFAAYAVVHLCAATLFGSAWFDRADAFEAYSTMAGRLAPLARRDDGRLVLRGPFDGLDSLRPEPGLVAVVCVWLGSTAFDGFTRSSVWQDIVRTAVEADVLTITSDEVRSAGFVVAIGLVAGLYVACTALSTRWGTEAGRASPRQFAHSLVPIAIGYTIAHYFSLALFAGQRTVILLSDPLDNGSNLFGTAGLHPDYAVLSNDEIALVQITAVILGHVVGVIVAHDRATRLFSRRKAVSSQVPLLVLMVTYTVGGLSLLLAT